MSDSFALALFLVSLVLLAVLLVGVVIGRAFRRSRIGLLGLGFGLVVQAIGHLIGLATGHHPARPIVQVAYLVVSVAVVPVGLALAGPVDSAGSTDSAGPVDSAGSTDSAEPDRWTAALLGLTAAICAVLILRIQTTWRPGHG